MTARSWPDGRPRTRRSTRSPSPPVAGGAPRRARPRPGGRTELGLELGQTVRVARQPDRPTEQGAVKGGPIAVVPARRGRRPRISRRRRPSSASPGSVSTPNLGLDQPGDLAALAGTEALDRRSSTGSTRRRPRPSWRAALRSITADLRPMPSPAARPTSRRRRTSTGRPALRADPARLLGVRAPRGRVHHRQRRQWHRADRATGTSG